MEIRQNFCKCNLHGDRPDRKLFVRNGVTRCARCEKPVNTCPDCGALQEPGVRRPCEREGVCRATSIAS